MVLESEGMLAAGSNQYLQPDYLSPIPTTLDSKKSPLALLAQTCSQIGADSSKPLPNEKKKDGGSGGEEKKDKTPTPAEPPRRSPAFKPYESSTPRKEEPEDQPRPASSQASARPSSATSNGGSSHKEDGRRSSEASTSSASATPIIRSGLEVLAGHPKDVPLGTYRTAASSFFPPGYPTFDSHPAFRGAHPSLMHPSFSIPSLASLSSAYQGLYPAAMIATSPYLSYTRVKTAGGGEAVVPVCRDPYCTGCPYSLQNNHLLLSGGACPPSCTQCEQAKAALSAVPGLSSVPPSSLVPASSLLPPTSAASLYSSSLFSPGPPRALTCSWMAGADNYCGKRFSNADDLLQHLRTHTTTSVTEASALSMLSNPLHAHAALLNSAAAHSALHRPSFSPPSLSPLAARYHPYGKPPSALGPSLSSLPPYAHTALTSAGYPPGYPSPYASLYPRPSL